MLLKKKEKIPFNITFLSVGWFIGVLRLKDPLGTCCATNFCQSTSEPLNSGTFFWFVSVIIIGG